MALPLRRSSPTTSTPAATAPVRASSGLAARAARAQVYGAGNYFKDGKHEVKIRRVLEKNSDRGNGKAYFIIECELLSSNNPLCRTGDLVTQIIDVTKDTGPGNVKGFLMCVASHLYEDYNVQDLEDEGFIGELLDSVLMEEQAATGLVVAVNCATIATRAGTPFTKVMWEVAE